MQHNIDLFTWNCTHLPDGMRFTFPAPAGSGYTALGFVTRSSCTLDAMDYLGLSLRFEPLAQDGVVTVTVLLAPPPDEHQDRELSSLSLSLPCAAGCSGLTAAWEDFPVETARRSTWQFISGFEVTGAVLRSAIVRRAAALAVQCEVQGRSAPAGKTVSYTVQVCNCADRPVWVRAAQQYEGWEAANAEILPAEFPLAPNEEKELCVWVTVPPQTPPGGHETTHLRFTADGDSAAAAALTLQTLRALPHPYLYHDADGWRQVREKLAQYPKFRPEFERWKALADAWQPVPPEAGKPFCYPLETEDATMSTAYVYALTGERVYAEKLAQFFRFFTDEANGYPARLCGCNRSYVQEGHFFQHLAIPYDILAGGDVLTEPEHAAIARTFRLYMDLLDKDIRNGHMSNWVVSETLGALYCALSLQDWPRAMRFAFGPSGVFDQLRKGAFNDGWWHECSIGYNTWVSSMMLHAAHALRPFGVDMVYADFAQCWSSEVSSTYACREQQPPFAMANQKRGGNRRVSLHIKDLFDAVLPFLDWRGVMFGVNDSDEKTIDGVHFGSTYDLAYTYYHDPEYLPILNSFPHPDPVFGHPELPEYQPHSIRDNAVSDNIGLALLRSQTPERPVSEQIQAVLHYGSHGGAHGHFDITDLLCVMRNGRSLYNPEHSWWGYRHFMYKWHVQNSLTKNMVNVDDKMQLPADSRRLLFYSGSAVQAAAVEVRTPWVYPPYGGMDYDDSPGDFSKRLKMNRSWFPIDPSLEYSKISSPTEPILQRRLMAVTDDYIVLFDSLAGEQEHQYETTFQLKGFLGLEGDALCPDGHTAQYTLDPASDGQMITDCHWYEAEGGSCARFCNIFEDDTDQPLQCDRSSHNVPGILHADVYTAWPTQTRQVVGTCATYVGWAANQTGYNIPLTYRVETDGQTAAQGAFDAWLLGVGRAEADLRGVSELRLVTRCGDAVSESGKPVRTPQGIFWGRAELLLEDGSILPLSGLAPERIRRDNIDPGCGFGRDYAGGRVTIQGEEYPDAVPANTIDHDQEGALTIDLTGLGAVQFIGCVGADVFPGSEAQRRRFYAVRAPRTACARFVTVLEPYESRRMVRSVRAESADCVTVSLADGREQTLTLTGLEEENAPLSLHLTERQGRHILRDETAQ